jgi:uncharacterized protein
MTALLVSALLMGLFGGAHCAAMCGGVAGVLCSATPRDVPRKAAYVGAYNVGRVGSYAVLGLVFGALGTLATGALPLDGVRFALRGLAAVFLLAVGLHLAGLPTLVRRLESVGAPLWRRLAPITRRLLPIRSPVHAGLIGALWGLMPCGMLYSAFALAASAGSPGAGAATMAAFGVGTLPVMVTMGAVAQKVAKWATRAWVRRAAAAVVLGFGLWSSASLASQVGVGYLGKPSHCHP